MSSEDQGHFLTLAQGHLHLIIKTGFSLIPLGRFEPNFVSKLSGTGKWKSVNKMMVTWPRWPPCPYMVKTLHKSSLIDWYRWPYFNETWYVALETPAYHSLYKWWPLVDLDLFYGKVKVCNLGFTVGKSEKSWFLAHLSQRLIGVLIGY